MPFLLMVQQTDYSLYFVDFGRKEGRKERNDDQNKYRSNFGEVDVASAKNDKVNKLQK